MENSCGWDESDWGWGVQAVQSNQRQNSRDPWEGENVSLHRGVRRGSCDVPNMQHKPRCGDLSWCGFRWNLFVLGINWYICMYVQAKGRISNLLSRNVRPDPAFESVDILEAQQAFHAVGALPSLTFVFQAGQVLEIMYISATYWSNLTWGDLCNLRWRVWRRRGCSGPSCECRDGWRALFPPS